MLPHAVAVGEESYVDVEAGVADDNPLALVGKADKSDGSADSNEPDVSAAAEVSSVVADGEAVADGIDEAVVALL